jgi:protocatechuate 3,4-dioxygenase beta subunit
LRRFLVPMIAFPLLLVCVMPTWAVKGKVVDSAGKPVPKAVVRVVSTVFGQSQVKVADDQGAFSYAQTYGSRRVNYFVKVFDRDGKPMPGARVTWPPFPSNRTLTVYTDNNGQFDAKTPAAKGPSGPSGFKVQDASGAPAPKAVLEIKYSLHSTGSRIPMDEKGETHYSEERYSSTQLTAMADGFSFGRERSENGAPVTITLFPEEKAAGRIVGEDGKPVAGSSIVITNLSLSDAKGRYDSLSPDDWPNPRAPQAITNKQGRFVLHHLRSTSAYQNGSIGLSISKPGYATLHVGSGLQDLHKKLSIMQPRECRISGILYLPGKKGTAPAGTQLYVRVAGKNSESAQTAVRADGRFDFAKLPPGKATLFLSPGYGGGPESDRTPKEWTLRGRYMTLASGSRQQIELEAVPGVLISGILKDKESGKPLARASLQVTSDAMPTGMGWSNASTDENGQFRFRVPSGDAKIRVESAYRGERNVYFNREQPAMDISAKEGQDQTNLVFEISVSENEQDYGEYLYGQAVPGDFELKAGEYTLAWDKTVKSGRDIYAAPENSGDKAKARMAKLPTLISAKPKLYLFPFDGAGDDGVVFVALDESAGTGKGFDTGYIDANRNGDLSDDQPIKWKPDQYNHYSPWVTVASHQGPVGPSRTSNPAQIRLYLYGKDAQSIHLERKGAWVGQVESSKGKVQLATVDSNVNGVYGERTAVTSDLQLDYSNRGDCTYVDSTGHGSAVIYDSSPHMILLCDVCMLGKRLYTMHVNPVGDKVTISPYDAPTGRLMVRASSIRGMDGTVGFLELIGKLGYYRLDSWTGDAVTLPVGEYKVNQCQLKLKGKNGGTLNLWCQPDISAAVEADKETPVNITGDLKMTISPAEKEIRMKPGTSCGFNWDTRIGEKIVVSSLSSSEGQGAPTVSFLNKKGDLVYSTKAGST